LLCVYIPVGYYYYFYSHFISGFCFAPPLLTLQSLVFSDLYLFHLFQLIHVTYATMSLRDSSHTSPIKLLPVMHLADFIWIQPSLLYCRGSVLTVAATAAAAARQQGGGGSTGTAAGRGNGGGSTAATAAGRQQGDSGCNSAAAAIARRQRQWRPAWQLDSSSAAAAWRDWWQHRSGKCGSQRQHC
jgi:hypothetical protein